MSYFDNPKRKKPIGELLLTSDVAEILGVTGQRVITLEDTGRLPAAYRTPKGVRIFRRADVERVKREREERAATLRTLG